ncbi:MAG: TRAP transporter small permease subunit [Xanthomonadaceae bacterium]|nr:TRAP transporter small permease subunit [Xanthomonadaceae bacterium]
MRALFGLLRLITCLNVWVGKITAFFVVPIFLLILIEVFMRYFLGAPAVWTNELAQLIFGVYSIMAGGYLAVSNGHVNVDIVYARFPERARAVIDILTSTLFFLFIGSLLYFGVSMALDSMSTWERSQSAWNPYIWPFKLMIPVAATLLLLQGIVKLIKDILIAAGVALPPDLAPNGASENH